MPPSHLGTGASHCFGSPPLSLSGELQLCQTTTSALQVRLRLQPDSAPAASHLRPSARDPTGPGLVARRIARMGLKVDRVLFLKQKALAAHRPLLPGPRDLPFPPHTRRTSPAHAWRGASPARQWVRGWPGSPFRAPIPIPAPQEV